MSNDDRRSPNSASNPEINHTAFCGIGESQNCRRNWNAYSPAKTSETANQSHSRNQPLAPSNAAAELPLPEASAADWRHLCPVRSQGRSTGLRVLAGATRRRYIQMKIRKASKERRQTVELEGKRITDRPTIRAILDLLNRAQVVRVETHEGVTRILPRNVDQRALRIIELAGYDTAIYTTKVS